MSSISEKLEEIRRSEANKATSGNTDTTAHTYTAEELQLRANGEIKLNEVYKDVDNIEKNNLKKKLYRKIIILSTLTVVIEFLPRILFYLFFPDVKGESMPQFVVFMITMTPFVIIHSIVCLIIAFIDIRFTINSLRKKYTKLALIPGVLGVWLLLPYIFAGIVFLLQKLP